MIRKIIEIDEEKCDGCGLCVPSCEEGALAIVDGKARLVRDSLCDGFGNCLGECPQDAIRMIEREAEGFELPPAHAAVAAAAAHAQDRPTPHACPGSRVIAFGPSTGPAPASTGSGAPTALRQWPVQLSLVPPIAPYLHDADLLIAADCVPFAYADFHSRLLAGHAVLVSCPKLDDIQATLAKLTAIFRTARPRSVTVANVEVPCCFGIVQVTRMALEAAEHVVPVRVVTIGIDGSL